MKKIYNLIGLAYKAGKASSGSMAVKESLGQGKACLLIICSDIAGNTKAELIKNGEKTKTPWIMAGSKYELGSCIGKSHRVAITINDMGFAQALLKESETAGLEIKCAGVV